jgi:ElaB/YqjD/DUF883 family membrane-anchored ribosome-binding protein
MRGSPVNRLEALLPSSAAYSADDREQSSLAIRAKTWEHRLEQFIEDHPRLTLGVAAAAGLVIGWMVKRR